MTTTVVSAGQTSSGITVYDGDSLTVQSGGIANAITVEAGGTMYVQSGGVASDTVVSASSSGYAQFYVEAGGSATGTLLTAAYDNYAELTVAPGGSATDTTVGNGGSGFAIFTVDADATATNTSVGGGGTEMLTVGSGQVLDLPVISSGIQVTLDSGAVVRSGTQIDGGLVMGGTTTGLVVNGGILELFSGASASDAVLYDGSIEVGQGATAESTVVNGGFLNVFGGAASGTVLNDPSDGPTYEQVWNGGVTHDTLVGPEATELVTSNGTAIGSTVQGGGVEILQGGGTIEGTTLAVGGTIDLSGVAAVPGGVATLDAGDDVLMLDGGTTLQLAGDYAGDAFALASDGSGGTDVTLEPILSVVDTTADQALGASAQDYSGPVSGLQEQYINDATDSLNVTVSTDDWFIHTGSGEDAIAVAGGTNVLDGGTGSNFLVGGSGTGTGAGFDTFFVDDRDPPAPTWSTVVNFHGGDAATVWGVTPQDFNLSWLDGQGAVRYAGLTLMATAPGLPTAR